MYSRTLKGAQVHKHNISTKLFTINENSGGKIESVKRFADTDMYFVVVIVSLSFIDSIFDELFFFVMVCFGV